MAGEWDRHGLSHSSFHILVMCFTLTLGKFSKSILSSRYFSCSGRLHVDIHNVSVLNDNNICTCMLIYVNVNLHKLSKNINSYFCRCFKIMECSFKKADSK